MTTIEPSASLPGEAALPAAVPAARIDRLEAWLSRLGDRLNPILVKEARQALRSRQFVITFFLMLLAGWLWSIVGLANIGSAVYYSAQGPQMLFAYHLILSFPLLVVAPYAAFHSLSSERNDRTYELLSITALGARQILAGKLGAIMLQMVVYLSAIFPCLAFTYLLRGLDIVMILVIVIYTCAVSLALSVTGLLLGAIAPLRQRHIGLSVIFALMLFIAFWLDNAWINSLIYYSRLTFDSQYFWEQQLVFLTLFVNYVAIVFLAARSQLLTVAENRSTALRWSLVAAQLSFIAWITRLEFFAGGERAALAFVYFSAVGWFLTGMFLVGESPELSPRVKRDLPDSTLARWALTWFTPGPGTGLVFVSLNMVVAGAMALLSLVAVKIAIDWWQPNATNLGPLTTGWTSQDMWEVFAAAVLGTSYVVIYLGITALIVRAARRFMEVRLPVPVLVSVFLLMVGCLTPWVAQMTLFDPPITRWTLLQISNVLWTMTDVCFRTVPIDLPTLLVALPAAAAAVWLLNLPSILDDLQQVRIAPPVRVAEEEAELAARHAAPRGPKNPWDVPPAEGA